MRLARGDATTRERLSADDLLLRAAAALAGGGYGGDAELTADIQGMLGRLLHDRALVDLADSLGARGEHAVADGDMDAALALLPGAGGHDVAVTQAVLEAASARIDPSQLGEARMALGEAQLEEGRVAEALPALATLRAAGPPIPRTVAARLVALALAETARFDDALVLLHETLSTRVELWGDGHPSTALVMQRVGSVPGHAGRGAEAQQWLLRVAGTADVREHSHGSVKHRAAVPLVLLDVECGRFEAALAPAALLRARLGCGSTEELEQAFAALMALSMPLFKSAPQQLVVRAVRVRWLVAIGRLQDARGAGRGGQGTCAAAARAAVHPAARRSEGSTGGGAGRSRRGRATLIGLLEGPRLPGATVSGSSGSPRTSR